MLRILLLIFTLLPLTATAQSAQDIKIHNHLAHISNLLNRTETIEAPFTQYNADGSTSNGTMYMRRPGRLRMEYTRDTDPLVIVGGSRVSIYDGKKDIRPEVYPLRRTPLYHLLKHHVNLTKREGITKAWMQDGWFWITAFDPDTPEAGEVNFYFDPNTHEMRGWWTQDSGGHVHVKLGTYKKGHQLSNFLFSERHETEQRDR